MIARARSIGSSSARKPRTVARIASWSAVGIRSIATSALRARRLAGETQKPLADDVPLDVLGPGRDGRLEREEVAEDPRLPHAPADGAGLPGLALTRVPFEDRRSEDVHRETEHALLELGVEEADHRAVGARRTGPISPADAPVGHRAEHLDLRSCERETAADLLVVERHAYLSAPVESAVGSPDRHHSRELDQLVDLTGEMHLMREESGAALEAERRLRDAPAIVQPTDDVRDRDPDLVVEDLAELQVGRHRADRADGDALRVHRTDHPADAGVLGRRRVGADEELLKVGDLGEARPDLLPAHDQLVAVDDGARLQGGEIRAGARLGEALAPHHLAAQDPREMKALLLFGPASDERRAAVVQTDEESRGLEHASERVLLVPDELLREGGAASAVALRPGDPGPARVVHLALPREVERAARPEVGLRRRVLRLVRLEPGARAEAKLLLGRTEFDVHRVDRES